MGNITSRRRRQRRSQPTNLDLPNIPVSDLIHDVSSLEYEPQMEEFEQNEDIPNVSENPEDNNSNSERETPNPSRFRILSVISFTEPLPNSSENSTTQRTPRRILLFIFTDRNELEEEDGEHVFHDFLNRLFEMHQPQGTPPASEKAIEALPKITINEEIVDNQNKCSICFEEFQIGNFCVEMPCGHVYDQECLETWLKQHNTCPVCRYEIPVDDAEYERERIKRMEQIDHRDRLPPIHETQDNSS